MINNIISHLLKLMIVFRINQMSLLNCPLILMFKVYRSLIGTELIGIDVDGWHKRRIILCDDTGFNILELVSDGVVGVGGVSDGLVGLRVDEVFAAVGDGLAGVHLAHF